MMSRHNTELCTKSPGFLAYVGVPERHSLHKLRVKNAALIMMFRLRFSSKDVTRVTSLRSATLGLGLWGYTICEVCAVTLGNPSQDFWCRAP